MPIAKSAAIFVTLSSIATGAALVGTGCTKKEPPLPMRDTEGRSFEATCNRAGECTLQSTLTARPSPPTPDGAKASWVLMKEGRYFGACDAWSGSAPQPWDCRAIVCNSDDDCPAIAGARTGMCTKGLCGDPASAISAFDSVMLCLAGTGPGYESPAQIERYAMGKECGSPCRVPTPCRQP